MANNEERSKIMLCFGEEMDGTNYAMSSVTDDGKFLIHESDEKAKESIRNSAVLRKFCVYKDEKKNVKKGGKKNKKGKQNPPSIASVLGAMIAAREAEKNAKISPIKHAVPVKIASEDVIENLQDSEKASSESSWIRPYVYLLILAPIYVPVICYFGAPFFDAIILFFKQLFL